MDLVSDVLAMYCRWRPLRLITFISLVVLVYIMLFVYPPPPGNGMLYSSGQRMQSSLQRYLDDGRWTSLEGPDVPVRLTKLTSHQRKLLNCTKFSESEMDWQLLNRTLSLGSPFDYLPNYRSPCWRGSMGSVRCLPLVYIGGFQKCGTTDLRAAMNRLPDVSFSKIKEPQWWTSTSAQITRPMKENQVNFDEYVDSLTEQVVSSRESNTNRYNPIITGEASANTAWHNDRWPLYPGNEGLAEPEYLVAHRIRQVTPQAKFIFLMRDPVERLRSHYLMNIRLLAGHGNTSDDFHALVVRSLSLVTACLQRHSVRQCAYSPCLRKVDGEEKPLPVTVGMYSVYLRDWMKIFPRDQIKLIQFEAYTESRSKVLDELADFLDTGRISRNSAKEMETMDVKNQKSSAGPGMRPDTRRLLQEFYAPFNNDLARILGRDQPWWRYD